MLLRQESNHINMSFKWTLGYIPWNHLTFHEIRSHSTKLRLDSTKLCNYMILWQPIIRNKKICLKMKEKTSKCRYKSKFYLNFISYSTNFTPNSTKKCQLLQKYKLQGQLLRKFKFESQLIRNLNSQGEFKQIFVKEAKKKKFFTGNVVWTLGRMRYSWRFDSVRLSFGSNASSPEKYKT